jgi:hypothetical protein
MFNRRTEESAKTVIEPSVGRARMVLVSSNDGLAVIATLIASVRDDSEGERVRFTGDAGFSDSAIKRILGTVLPIVVQICEGLALPSLNINVGLLNLNATAAKDLTLKVTGHSADVSAFLAMLSAALDIALPQDIVATGQLASVTGDIALVSEIPAKAAAAAANPNIRAFLFPALDVDRSLEMLAPAERERIEGALAQASTDVRTMSIRDIAELLELVLNDENLALCSLHHGFFKATSSTENPSSTITRAIQLFTNGNDVRLWSSVEARLFAGENAELGRLLRAFVAFYIEEKSYPVCFGARLTQLLYSLPPAIRRARLNFPLIPMDQCISLSQFAKDTDHQDVAALYEANLGKVSPAATDASAPISENVDNNDIGRAAIDVIFHELDAEVIANKVESPIDEARGNFIAGPVVANSSDEVLQVCTALYLLILRYTGEEWLAPNYETAMANTLELLDQAFAREGGDKAAYIEGCRPGRRGSMRFVIDALTDQMKARAREKRIRYIIRQSIDPRSEKEKIAFIRAFLKRFGPFLPSDIAQGDPKYYATEYETLIRAYAHSLDSVKDVLRRL